MNRLPAAAAFLLRAVLVFLLAAVFAITLSGNAQALSFDLPAEGDSVIGEMQVITAKHEDTLPALGMRYGIGYREMVAANPTLNPWLPGEGAQVYIPTRFVLPPGERKGIVLNLSELRLYYYPPNENRVITYAVGIGREGWTTPVVKTRIASMRKAPSWTPPQSIREEYAAEGKPLAAVVPPGPDNPLGNYALRLGLPSYLIHGTNKPLGVGMRVSHGCVRMFPQDIEELFAMVAPGLPVSIIKMPYKAGWLNGRLYLEAHKPLSEEFEEAGLDLTRMVEAIIKAHKDHEAAINWDLAESSARKHHGLPVAITSAPMSISAR